MALVQIGHVRPWELTVETPEDSTLPLSEVIETLEMISTMAVAGIRNARIAEELIEKENASVDRQGEFDFAVRDKQAWRSTQSVLPRRRRLSSSER